VREQFKHPYGTTGKITVLYILMFWVSVEERGRQKILNWMVARISWI
jgi:hypothetical protein